MNRSKGRAKSIPIDHVLGNRHSLDLGIAAVSDHVPIVVRLHLCSPEFAVVDWPKSWNKTLKVKKIVQSGSQDRVVSKGVVLADDPPTLAFWKKKQGNH